MKRLSLILLSLCIFSLATAQTAREEIDAHPHLSTVTQSVYAGPYYFKPIADAPKGYKPFYMTNYGRHGSRHESNDKYTTRVVNFLRKTNAEGLLTPTGKEVLALMEKLHAAHINHTGELTRVGVEQHKGIARRTYHRFKPLFKSGSIIESRSSTYTRCILSMVAFNESLKECEPMLETRMDASESFQHIIRPTSASSNPAFPKNMGHTERQEKSEWYNGIVQWSLKQDVSRSLNLLFTDWKKVEHSISPFYTVYDIFRRISFAQNLGWYDRSLVDHVYNADERYLFYLYDNYRWYMTNVSTHDAYSRKILSYADVLINDIIEHADDAISGKNSASANFRFGHDYYLLNLVSFMNFNEMPSTCGNMGIEELGEKWRAYRYVTMASSLQMVLYKSKKCEDILVRFLHNENDVTLPIKSDIAPFYKWEDVKTYMKERLEFMRTH